MKNLCCLLSQRGQAHILTLEDDFKRLTELIDSPHTFPTLHLFCNFLGCYTIYVTIMFKGIAVLTHKWTHSISVSLSGTYRMEDLEKLTELSESKTRFLESNPKEAVQIWTKQGGVERQRARDVIKELADELV